MFLKPKPDRLSDSGVVSVLVRFRAGRGLSPRYIARYYLLEALVYDLYKGLDIFYYIDRPSREGVLKGTAALSYLGSSVFFG